MAAKDLRFLILLMRSRGYSFGSQPSTMDSNGQTFAWLWTVIDVT